MPNLHKYHCWLHGSGKNKKMSETQNAVKKITNIGIALGEPLLHIKQLIPLLEYRNEVAVRYMKQRQCSEEEKNNYENLIDSINDNIVKVLGL